jgi:acyl dehydratase
MSIDLGAIGQSIGPLTKEYTWKDVVLYALSVGAGFDELEYCYENRLKVLPTFSIASIFEFLASVAMLSKVNLAGVLHAEQEIVFHQSIPKEGVLSTQGRIESIHDKGPGKGALVKATADTHHANGKLLFSNLFSMYARFDGGFSGQEPPKENFSFPERAPEHCQSDLPSESQPLLYRLSGDVFGLHVDPDFAQACGFEKPIMHGLCTFGFACRALIKHLTPGRPESIKRLKVRFRRPLYPGVPIHTKIWKKDNNAAVFRVENAQTNEVVIDRGVVEWDGP